MYNIQDYDILITNNNVNLKNIVDIADTNFYEKSFKENKVCKNCAVRYLTF